jgi:protein-S-isoprenylcysteine O-methyltransferase Ste14
MTVEAFNELSSGRVQSSLYWISAAFATIVLLVVLFFFLMVPGGTTSEKLWTLSVTGLLLACSLAVGFWGFRTRDVPALTWPAGPPVAAILLSELVYCLVGLIAQIAKS